MFSYRTFYWTGYVSILHCSSICQRNLDLFYMVSYYIKWFTTSWTDSMYNLSLLACLGSIWRCFNLTMFQLDHDSIWRCFNLTLIQYNAVTIWRCFKLTLFQFDAVSIRRCFNLTPFQFDAVSIWRCFNLKMFELDAV